MIKFLLANLSYLQAATNPTCLTAVDRLKDGPENWVTLINAGTVYTDNTFKEKDQLYLKNFISNSDKTTWDASFTFTG